MLTISKLKRWSINYYIDTAQAAELAARDLARAGGGLEEYYSERETRTPAWLLAGDTHAAARLVGLTDAQHAGGDADVGLVAHWLDGGITPNGAHGRAFGQRGVHGFDLTFCAPKSVSLVRALRTDDVVAKAIADAHTTALGEAMEYLATHAGYTRIHNPHNGERDLVRLPGLAAIAYRHETSRCGDPHLHTHVIVPNRQARADGQVVSIDGTSLYHEARAAGVIYQAALRRELHHSMAFEWAPVDPSTGMAELAGVDRDTITADTASSSATSSPLARTTPPSRCAIPRTPQPSRVRFAMGSAGGCVAAAIVSLLTILTIRETAGRSLSQGVADEMFQSNADVRGAATPGQRRSYS